MKASNKEQIKAVARYMRVSHKKVKQIIDAVKGKHIEEGQNILKFMPQKAAKITLGVLNSAIANAENNFEKDIDELFIENVIVDQGPTLKRFKPRARGRSSRILKRTSHITVILS